MRMIKDNQFVLKTCSMMLVVLMVAGSLPVISSSAVTEKQMHQCVCFGDISIEQQENGARVYLENADQVLMQGDHVMVPTTMKTYTFPLGTMIDAVSCISRIVQSERLSSPLMVAPRMQSASSGEAEQEPVATRDPVVKDAWYEYTVSQGRVDDASCVIVTVQLFPVRYDPDSLVITWAEEMDIEIQYHQEEATLSADEDYQLLILSADEFISTLSGFVAHKEARGIATKLVSLSEISAGWYTPVEGRDAAEQVKYFIKYAYDTWGISNVLLVGGYEFFPTRKPFLEIEDEGETYTCSMVSDLYFADLYDATGSFQTWDTNNNDIFGEYNWEGETDSIDLYPDVYIGRLPCISTAELQGVLNKIMVYESGDAYAQDWFSRFTVIAGDSAPGDEEGIDEGEYAAELAISVMDGFVPFRVYASNGDLFSKATMTNAFNDGAGIIYLSGHGSKTSWSTHPHEKPNVWLPPGGYKSNDLGMLTSDTQYSIVLLDACYVGQFDKAEDCFSWSFLRNDHGGAIGVLSSTYTSYFYPTSYVTEDIIGKMCQDMIKGYALDAAVTLGEMWANGVNRYISPAMDGADYFTVEEFILMGDPTLSIAKESAAPSRPTVDGPPSGTVDEAVVFTATASDPEGDPISYLFDWGDGSVSDWIGPVDSGTSVEAAHQWDSQGSFEVRVMAKDDHGVKSDWSEPFPISMPKGKQVQHIWSWIQLIFEEWLPFLR